MHTKRRDQVAFRHRGLHHDAINANSGQSTAQTRTSMPACLPEVNSHLLPRRQSSWPWPWLFLGASAGGSSRSSPGCEISALLRLPPSEMGSLDGVHAGDGSFRLPPRRRPDLTFEPQTLGGLRTNCWRARRVNRRMASSNRRQHVKLVRQCSPSPNLATQRGQTKLLPRQSGII